MIILLSMFDILFGWRKASKCKKLVELLHCRLNLLKRKRYSIVRQLREDIAQLLKIGQNEAAFARVRLELRLRLRFSRIIFHMLLLKRSCSLNPKRVELLFKDQSLLDAYDLLDRYCEFIILHFRYIRRHKDRPKDINEAVSTLIFAAAWFGDLPELRSIRNIFGNRYGQKFIKDVTALQSGNLVNHEIKEKLCIKFITDAEKQKLINEIAKDYGLQLWHLGCDNRPKHLLQLSGNIDHQLERFVFEGEACIGYSSTSEAMTLASYAKHSLDVASKLIIHPLEKAPILRIAVQIENRPQDKYIYELSDQSNLESSGSNKLSSASFQGNADISRTETPDISFQYHKRTVYVEEVEELEFNGEDKRLFLFNASLCLLIDNYGVDGSTLLALSYYGYSEGNFNKPKPQNKIALSGKTHERMRKSYVHRLEGRVDTKNNQKFKTLLTPVNMKENYCVVLNGELSNFSPCQKHFYHRISHLQDKQRTMMAAKECRSASLVCYEKVLYKPVKGDVQSCKWTCSQKKSYCSSRFSPEKNSTCCLEKSCYIRDRQANGTQIQESRKLMQAEEASDCPARYASSDGSSSKGPSPYSRKSTIPPKRIKDTSPDSDKQSVSSQFQLSKVSTNSSCSHVHPKLPDYDELEAKFRALKKEHQLRNSSARHGLNIT